MPTPEEAVYKMTGLPALCMGLKDRGMISKDNYADIVIFNPATVQDQSTFEEPHQYPQGILYVIVTGVVTVNNGKFTSDHPGKMLYGPAKN